MTCSRANSALVIIDSTEVNAALSGQGVGRRLLDVAVAWARKTQTKIMANARLPVPSSRKIRRYVTSLPELPLLCRSREFAQVAHLEHTFRRTVPRGANHRPT